MLERQNDRLKEFTDILSHDLRSPLSVINGRLELYDERGEPAHLEAIGETTERMERLVADLLNVARQGRVVEDPQPTSIETAQEWVLTERTMCAYDPIPAVMADRPRLV
jgi:signal transduction histidine kinase